LLILAIWTIPMMILGVVIVTNQPGHVLSYLPGWFVLVGAVVASLKGRWPRVATIFVICGMNVVAFVAWPPQWDGVFFRMARTAREIAEHDRQLSQIVAAIRRSYSPRAVIICHGAEFLLYGVRHFQLYLPEFEQYQLGDDVTILHPPGKSLWRVRDGRLEFVDKLDLSGKDGVVLLVPPGERVEVFTPYLSVASMRALARGSNDLYFLSEDQMKLLR
jgi:hypothetical protein